MRRFAALIMIVAGLWLCSMPAVFSLFTRTSAAAHVTNSFRSTLSDTGLAQLEHNYGIIRGLGTQFVGDLRPALARQMGMSQAQFDSFTASNFPAVGAALKVVPPAIALVDPVIPQLAQIGRSGDFHRADDIPGLGLSVKAVPWLLLALGAIMICLGLVALIRGSRWAIGAGLALGAATVVVALALNLPAKFNATYRLVKVGRIALSQKAADTATQTVSVVDAMVKQVQGQVVPALATRLGESPVQLADSIGRNYQAVAAGLADWPAIEPSAAELASAQRANVAQFAKGDGAPFRTLPWLVIGPALIVALACGAALWAGSSRPNRHRPGRRPQEV
jgi:hypothetical protein